MSNLSCPKVIADVGWVWFTKPSMRTTNLDIRVSIGPEVDIGWVSSITASIFYGNALIGEATQEDTFLESPEYDNTYDMKLQNFEIQDMTAFKSLIRNIMPNTKNRYQPGYRKPIAELEVLEKGHKLAVVVNLYGTGVFKTTAPRVQLTGDSILITFSISNQPHVELWFENAKYILEKDGETLARLTGSLEIEADGGSPVNYQCEGELSSYWKQSSNCKFFGKGKLRGVDLGSDSDTWFCHAIREFEMEVDLDEVIVCKDE